jgi:hypothetical protein
MSVIERDIGLLMIGLSTLFVLQQGQRTFVGKSHNAMDLSLLSDLIPWFESITFRFIQHRHCFMLMYINASVFLLIIRVATHEL